jgi:hypothetical protein
VDWNGLLTGVVGAVVGTIGTLYVTRHAIRATVEADRATRRETDTQARVAALRAAAVELRLNAAMPSDDERRMRGAGEQFVFTVWVPFRRQALDAALLYLPDLPAGVAEALQRADFALARYNATLERPTAREAHDTVREFAGDPYAVVRATQVEAVPLMESAASALDGHLTPTRQTVASGRAARSRSTPNGLGA